MKQDLTILFDLDGTLIDSTDAIVTSFNYALQKHGYKIPAKEKITQNIGHPLSEMFSRLGVSTQDLNEVITSYKLKYRTISKQMTSFLPKAKEAIQLARSYGKVAAVTTKTSKYSKEILEHLGVREYFQGIVGFEDVQHHKPHKEPILKALQILKTQDFKSVYMIGDTQLDILSAKNAKVNSFAVTSGYESEQSLIKFTNHIKPNAFEAVKEIIKIFAASQKL